MLACAKSPFREDRYKGAKNDSRFRPFDYAALRSGKGWMGCFVRARMGMSGAMYEGLIERKRGREALGPAGG